MTPAKIVKSAHERAGKPTPLKQFARLHAEQDTDLGSACRAWLKAKGRLTAAQQEARSAKFIEEAIQRATKRAVQRAAKEWSE